MRSYRTDPPALVAGDVSLDFVNTVSWRGDPLDVGERLSSYEELLAWGQSAGVVRAPEAARLRQDAAADPERAALALADAVLLRESLARLFVERSGAPSADLARLNRKLLQGGAPRLLLTPGGFGWDDLAQEDRLQTPALRIARAAAMLLTRPAAERVRTCADARCGWLFLDDSPTGGRRWCRMSTCGNRAKARAHLGRLKTATPRRRA